MEENIVMFAVMAIILVVIISVSVWFTKKQKKKNTTERTSGRKIYNSKSTSSLLQLLAGIALVISFGCVLGSEKMKTADSNNYSPADGFTIEKYDVEMDVSEDNVASITEDITLNFYQSKHGIYRVLPTWLKYTSKDGNTMSRKYIPYNIDVLDEHFKVNNKNNKKHITIGSKNDTVYGQKEYKIQYKYNMGEDPYKGFDEFIFHTFGDYWGTAIKNASITITMPKSIDEDKVRFFNDKYRKRDITDEINYYVNDNTISVYLPYGYTLDNSLTVDIELPDGYFKTAKSVYSNTTLVFYVIVLITCIIEFIIWLLRGKDKKEIETVEFYAPDELDSAEVGYIYKKDGGRKLAISLIIELSSKGYILINDVDDKKTITKQTDSKVLEKLVPMTSNEEIVYDALFKNGDTNIISEDKEFYTIFQEIEYNLIETLDSKIYDSKSYTYQKIFAFISLIYNAYMIVVFVAIEDLDPKYSSLSFVVLIALSAIFIITLLMSRKSTYGEQLVAKIRGFKDYIKTAEKDQIDEMMKKNPNYYYDILPYAYILGVSTAWAAKFDTIPQPQYPMGTVDFSDTNTFDTISSDIYSPSGSSSGGGCSSCGGGCSSCGGGGSW